MNFLHNGLIAQLSPADQALLLRKAKIIHFSVGETLGGADLKSPQIYFITRGCVALFVCKKSNDVSSELAVGLVGSEGALGLQMALGIGQGNLTLIAQSSGSAYAVDSGVATQIVRRKSALLLTFAKYMWIQLENVAELAAMSHTQEIRIRLAHWLLLSARRFKPDQLILTHTQIAQMLGVRRVSITLEAREMKMMGLISYSRGHIQLKNLEELERLAQGDVPRRLTKTKK